MISVLTQSLPGWTTLVLSFSLSCCFLIIKWRPWYLLPKVAMRAQWFSKPLPMRSRLGYALALHNGPVCESLLVDGDLLEDREQM